MKKERIRVEQRRGWRFKGVILGFNQIVSKHQGNIPLYNNLITAYGYYNILEGNFINVKNLKGNIRITLNLNDINLKNS